MNDTHVAPVIALFPEDPVDPPEPTWRSVLITRIAQILDATLEPGDIDLLSALGEWDELIEDAKLTKRSAPRGFVRRRADLGFRLTASQECDQDMQVRGHFEGSANAVANARSALDHAPLPAPKPGSTPRFPAVHR